jgi:5-oxoprolinase (ATP-hydrolysing)
MRRFLCSTAHFSFLWSLSYSTAGITIQAPQLDINTVAAGGGSMLFFKNGLFVVGPESAGAHPGPTSYGKGGPLTITDANLLLNRLLPEHFPRIFGKNQDQQLDLAASRSKFEELTGQINAYFEATGASTRMQPYDVALGFISVANEAMCRPIRALTQSKGYDITRHTLACFGGAGGQHAAAIARNLGLKTIFLHRFSGILSAYGLGLADVVQEKQEPCTQELKAEHMPSVLKRIEGLKQAAVAELEKYGFRLGHKTAKGSKPQVEVQVFLNLRFVGTDTSVMTTLHREDGNEAVPTTSNQSGEAAADDANTAAEESKEEPPAGAAGGKGKKGSAKKKATTTKALASSSKGKKAGASSAHQSLVDQYRSIFIARYRREYGFSLARPVVIDDIRVRAIGHSEGVVKIPISQSSQNRPKPHQVVQTFFDSPGEASGKFLDTGVFLLAELHADDHVYGPAVIIDKTSTTLIEPGCHAHVTPYGDLEIYVGENEGQSQTIGLELDNIQLSIFSHRFMSIAEQMGRTLQRTAISTNIRERNDFSCALFGPDGGLVANAPHLPVHLGAMVR